jgi:hypothetical protein
MGWQDLRQHRPLQLEPARDCPLLVGAHLAHAVDDIDEKDRPYVVQPGQMEWRLHGSI